MFLLFANYFRLGNLSLVKKSPLTMNNLTNKADKLRKTDKLNHLQKLTHLRDPY